MINKDFGKAAEDFAPFKMVLGKMLREFGEISSDDYNLVGQVQAKTVVIVEASQTGTPDQKTMIIDRFGGSDWKTKEPTGKLDLNGAMFKLKKETALDELNGVLSALGIEEIDSKMDAAIQAVHAEKGVHPDAAASAVILKALCLSEYDRDAKQAIVDGSLIMQMSLRGLERIEGFENGNYDRQAALSLQNLSNKLDYERDPLPLVNTNEALLQICSTEMRIHTKLETNPELDLLTLQKLYEPIIRDDIQTLVESMPAAVEMYKKAGKDALAEKAQKAYDFYSEKYADILVLPHIMGAPTKKNDGPDNNPKLTP